MAFSFTWNATFESQPADSENISQGAGRIRDLKKAISERTEVDHSWAGDANDGKHKKIQLTDQAGSTPAGEAGDETIWQEGGALKRRSGTGAVQELGVVPVGGIIAWSGSIANIPAGWALCDGNNGTPDLRNRFIQGAESDASGTKPNDVGGSETHDHGGATGSHTHSTPAHQHQLPLGFAGANGIAFDDDTAPYGTSGTRVFDRKADTVASGESLGIMLSQNDGAGTSGGSTASISSVNHEPPWYALAYIMFVG